MKTHSISEAKDDICRIIREAEGDQVLITRHGKPAAVVIGFRNEDDWLEFRLLNDERFQQRVAAARAEIRAGNYVRLDDLEP